MHQANSPINHQINTSQRAILIDLDGTLVDTAPDIFAAVNRMLDDLDAGPLPFETVCSFIGKGVPNLVRRARDATGITDRFDSQYVEDLFHHHYRETNGHFGSVFTGVREGLTQLKEAGFRLGVVTNKPFELAESLLQIAGLDSYFDVVVGGDSLSTMKPAAEPLLHACDVLGASPARAFMVGDSAVDVDAARAAEMPVYIVRYGYPGPGGLDALKCDGLITSFMELAALAEPLSPVGSTSAEEEIRPTLRLPKKRLNS
ncbi:phosphoglycolate phosphatase [Glaciimonas sp. PCH181]|uniref:phosphoglycolate phosphatase n=1 Tax=Glaciimonas sp. PCH181 TaxID=2133943 RepID=UPI000D37F273|nr:phosphoglycolate phosphatase [Glaciimonas sp. PCH181]PUA17495.1 phosphoglycolate phosphatase [Glaciimonas sp. PCH181]